MSKMVILNEVEEGSASTNRYRYDVFLSFRGADTRLGFTDHLHKFLKNAGLTTFYDDEEIRTGEKLKPELESAIKASKASVIVLSKNYASSRWCLDEIVLIMEQHRNFNQIVIPIFYHVEPTYIRKQLGSIGEAMVMHNQTMESETDAQKRSQWARNIDLWKKALKDVADLKGHNAQDRLETKLIEEIVNDIYQRIGLPIMTDLPLLIGMNYSIQFITSWLKDGSSQTGDVLTILGIGGIGKTSLAKYVYKIHCHEFNQSSFVEDISRRCGHPNGLLDVQKQLCHKILTSSIQVHDVSEYTYMIKNALERKKVLIVLDDIDSLDQLDALLGNKDLHPGSKIIITTKDASLTDSCSLLKMTTMKPKHMKHELKGLYEEASLELLCHHAFSCNNPEEGYEEVSKELVKYCDGHPLAFEVLGRLLHAKDVAYWKGCIQRLKRELPTSRLKEALQMSFECLPSHYDKELFLHIACFFVGMDKDTSETILKACDDLNDTETGIKNLIDRCLLRIEWNQLSMHSLIQEMGRDVVRQESPYPEKRTRLWYHEDSFKVLKKKKGTDNIKGLVLDMRMLEKQNLLFELNTNALTNMDNLLILHLNYVQINGSYENFPEEIRWLCMHGFPIKSIPSDLPMENLVVLDMSYSNIESFDMSDSNQEPYANRQKLIGSCSKNKPLLGSLKILDLSFCGHLRRIGGFSELPALERLIVRYCTSLIKVCESVEQCDKLLLVDLSYCSEFRKFAKTIDKVKNVKTLLLDGCNLGERSFTVRDMDSLKMHKANSIEINSLTSSSAIVEAIPRDSKSLAISLPRSLVKLSFAYNNLSNESFPMNLSSLSMLKELILNGNPIFSMPNCVTTLPRLEYLSMLDCKMLMSIDQPPPTLTTLSWGFIGSNYIPSLRNIVFDPEMAPLKLSMSLSVFGNSSIEIDGVVKIQPMADVEENILRSLGWSNLEFIKKRRVGTFGYLTGLEGFQTQMYYEFGIFSTFYGGEEMPNWIEDRIDGSSMSFSIPSSPPNRRLRGLNFCYVQTIPIQYWNSDYRDNRYRYPVHQLFRLPCIKISNITKNRSWIYNHFIHNKVNVGGNWLVFISHWMFGMHDDMEAGDYITLTVKHENEWYLIIKACGVSLVYEDGKEEEEVLDYYKSWNHIIGGDLSPFQLTTGEYFLYIKRVISDNVIPYNPFIRDAAYKEKRFYFKAFSQRRSKIRSQAIEATKERNMSKELQIVSSSAAVAAKSSDKTAISTLPPRHPNPSSAVVEYTPPVINQEDKDLEVKLRRIIDLVPVRVNNTSGSSAGSGSGDFHQYRQMRRKEQDLLARMDVDFQKRKELAEFNKRREERLKASEERTAKKRLKRQKKKQKKQEKKIKLEAGNHEDHKKEDKSSDEDQDSMHRQMTRKDQDCLARMDGDFQKRKELAEYKKRREERLKSSEERTAKKRLKRQKKKQRKQEKKIKLEAGNLKDHKEDKSSDEDQDSGNDE